MTSLFEGSAVALATPFRDGRVDTDAIGRLVERQNAAGTAAIIVCGTTGEPSTMTADERELTVRTVVKAVDGRIPVVAGTGTNCTQSVIDAAERYEGLGCAAQLVVTPYYNKTSPEGLCRHYETIAEKTKLPIVIYNVPSRTAIDLSPDVLDRLAGDERRRHRGQGKQL
jgi:4-hydroxy-tetrahydrodipicolinate synthase